MSLLSRNTRKQGIWSLPRRSSPLAPTKQGKALRDKREYPFDCQRTRFFDSLKKTPPLSDSRGVFLS